MAKLTLNKSTFLKETRKLESYEKYLPSLDLKRKQLLAEKKKADEACLVLQDQLHELFKKTTHDIPMLGNQELDYAGLLEVEAVDYKEENALGLILPSVEAIHFAEKVYGLYSKPHWVDLCLKRMREILSLKIHILNAKKRVDILGYASRKATQRVNLVSKVLIPESRNNIRKIQIFLSDNERSAVVRSKIAKNKRRLSEVSE